MFNRVCDVCGEDFKSQRSNSTTCYGCALERITGGLPPEEGDFNTALLSSGQMSDEDARHLQDDLESVDHSREEKFQSEMMKEYGDPWEDYREEDE